MPERVKDITLPQNTYKYLNKEIEYTFYIELTDICNHQCFYCYNNLFSNKINNNMTIETAKKIMNFINNIKVSHNKCINIILTGGEPFLNFNILKFFCNFLTENYELFDFTINTNLTNSIDDLKKLKEIIQKNNKNELKLVISMPSLDKIIYEKITNNNNYNIMYKNLKYLVKDSFYKLHFNTVVNNLNIDTTYQTILKLIMMGFNQFSLSYIIGENKISIKQLSYMQKKIDSLLDIFNIDLNGTRNKLFDNIDLNNKSDDFFINFYKKKESECKCVAGKKIFAFSNNGNIKPCALNDIVLENINNIKNIDELLYDSKYHFYCRDYVSFKD